MGRRADRVGGPARRPHDDITATIPLSVPGAVATGITAWLDTDEYGNPRTSTTPTATPAAYGWHGTKERSTDTPAALTLMGTRLYNPSTGRFLSIDPVPGGNDNAYNHPNDPNNAQDLDGRASTIKRWKSWYDYGVRAAKAPLKSMSRWHNVRNQPRSRAQPVPISSIAAGDQHLTTSSCRAAWVRCGYSRIAVTAATPVGCHE